MFREFCRGPTRAEIVAGIAGCREPHCRMNGIGCSNIVSLMAGIAVRTETGITAWGMTIVAVWNRVPLREGKKAVYESGTIPAQGIDRMT